MASELPIITNPEELTASVLSIRKDQNPAVVMCELGGGILRFAGAAFPEVATDKIYAQSNNREPEGRGAHFDVYGPFLEKDYPWLGLFNLAGRAGLSTTVLPDVLARAYADMYPVPTDEAFVARRHFSAIALGSSTAEVRTGTLDAGIGVVLPQKLAGPHIVHDIIPEDPDHPGKYIKLIAPSDTREANERMTTGGYKPLDELLSEGLGLVLEKDSAGMFPIEVDESLEVRTPTRQPQRRFSRVVRRPTLPHDDDYGPPVRRSCNLD